MIANGRKPSFPASNEVVEDEVPQPKETEIGEAEEEQHDAVRDRISEEIEKRQG